VRGYGHALGGYSCLRAVALAFLLLTANAKFPGQVVGILQAGIHPLAAHRRVDMRRVAYQKAAVPMPKAIGHAVVQLVGDEPAAICYLNLMIRTGYLL
jgi:hypothetical protein